MTNIFNRLYEAQEIARIMHLAAISKKESEHVALEEFYTNMTENIDLFVEVYQGQFDIVDGFGEFERVDTSDPVKYFLVFAQDVTKFKEENTDSKTSHFDTIYDDILISTYKLLYKLRFLN